MDYKEKYEQALKRAKAVLEVAANEEEAEGYVSTIFPELAESEDERIRKELIAWLKNSKGQSLPMDRYNAAIAWLKKRGKQKPDEWSEEDENNINSIVSRLEVDISYWESRSKTRTNEDKKLIGWLKSLRPQKTWKPSDEQMDALMRVKNCTSHYYGINDRLDSLYEDLKKL